MNNKNNKNKTYILVSRNKSKKQIDMSKLDGYTLVELARMAQSLSKKNINIQKVMNDIRR